MWLRERETILVLRDKQGTEQYNLLEIDPETGSLMPVLEDQFLKFKVRQQPTAPNRIAFISTRDRSLDLYTLDLDDGAVTRQSQTEEPVLGYAWSPDGERLIYQAAPAEEFDEDEGDETEENEVKADEEETDDEK